MARRGLRFLAHAVRQHVEQNGLALEQTSVEPLSKGNQRKVVFDQENQIENAVKTRFVQQRARNHALQRLRITLLLASVEQEREGVERVLRDAQTRDEVVVIAIDRETNDFLNIIVLLLLVIEADKEDEEIVEDERRAGDELGVVGRLILLCLTISRKCTSFDE